MPDAAEVEGMLDIPDISVIHSLRLNPSPSHRAIGHPVHGVCADIIGRV